jgi:DNA helicase-2/ATP-dependent DNA helicase PcrA
MARTYTLNRPAFLAPAGAKIDYAKELNPEQCAAVMAGPGPMLVIAGAGSGKTRTLVYRVAYLLGNGVDPANILLLTFTNKAAREMLERVSLLVPESTGGIWGGTFHSIGNKILRRHAEALGYRRGFSIMDREDQEDLMKAVITGAGINPKEKRFPKAEVVADIFSMAINTNRTSEQVIAEKYPYFLPLSAQITDVHRRYEAKKKATNTMDFDDLLEKTVRLLREHADVAAIFQRQFEFVLVDEYQDTNHIQAEFVDLLAAQHQNIMVVGDDAQSIYSWRGADCRNILEFPQRYPQARVYKIETNYRSVPEILEVANAAIAANVAQFPKNLHAVRAARAAKPAVIELNDSNQQALFVTQRILELRDEGTELNEIAVLYRAHFHSMELQLELTRHGVPFQITSGLRFFEQAHIKDVASFLKFGANHRDEVAFKRIVRLLPGIGGVAADKLWAGFERALAGREAVDSFADAFADARVGSKSEKMWKQFVHTLEEIAPGGKLVAPAGAIESVIEAVYEDYAKAKFPNYEARREDLNVLATYARQYSDPAEFLSQLALVTSLETQAEVASNEARDQEQVTLSSVHQAKGLEWKVVFIINLTEGSFPSGRSLESVADIEEERRLFYVAVTRARDELYLSHPYMRLNAGYGDMFQRPSRFLSEVPAALVEKWEVQRGY